MNVAKPWMELAESERKVVLAGLTAAAVVRRDEGFRSRLSKSFYDLASNSQGWVAHVERLLVESLIQGPLNYREQRSHIISAIGVIRELTGPRDMTVQVVVNADELRWLEENASLDNIVISDYVRIMALTAISEMHNRIPSESSIAAERVKQNRPARIGHPSSPQSG